MTQFFTTSDGTRIAYRDEGAGLPLLCLPGLTRTMGDFDYMIPHLPPYRLIRMDYRGRGESQWTGAATYTVPIEGRDAIELLDHLGVAQAAVIGTSRGGLIAMVLAAMAKDRLLGICFNDIGPEVHKPGLARIMDYVGRNPRVTTHAELAAALPALMLGFANVPESRWMEEAKLHYTATPDGLRITYDPTLRDSFLAAFDGPPTDLWPLFEACADLPIALIRGANSDLLTQSCADEMRARRPDMGFCNVPDRAHIPFLDEAAAVAVLRDWLGAIKIPATAPS
ncbi:Pimeloyl-ACP methyl ester carboxylesterase [Pseudorhodobacter antarcticus]|jgi:pimeloyl-ACP methyl ester carboxylesterase|uniref:Pimeloyl-ACP methyl ester carboxylesterase n=1 Tax=Pseudorhodobacter antarcticus TaxID=1077947 RepID=A0A1H8CNK6_9RHOB|nr:alpha/beta hydrolase [Pseudorhodobacter antarcticus]SEM96034.1 Pimeloyl-ACP methyl ester carboxylesterase [Pseudorhodobacter antarcticus]